MVTPTIFPPNPDNPDRPSVAGAGNDYVASFDNSNNAHFLRRDGTWAVPPGGAGSSVWGGITGTLSNQTDLQNALNLKANSSSLATVATTGAYNDLSGKPTLGTVAALSYPGGTTSFLRADGTWATVTDVNAVWGNITGTLSSQGDLNTALGLKAPLASPTFTGTPLAPTAAVDTNTTQIATTAWYINQLFSGTPLVNGTASSGSSLRAARGDHVHPTDTTRMANVLTTTGDLVYASSGSTAARLGIGTTGQLLGVASGAPAWLTPTPGPTFSAHRSTDQSLTPNTPNICLFDVEDWDNTNAFTPATTSHFNPQVAGKYQVNAQILLANLTGTPNNYQLYIYKNGIEYRRGNLWLAPPTGTSTMAIRVSAQVDMNGSSDYIQIACYPGTSGTIKIDGGAFTQNYFDAFLITPVYAVGGGGSVAWGSITGTLSAQTDLQTALNAKGDASGPASSVNGRVAMFNGTTGKLIADAGFLAADVVTGPASATSGRIPTFNGASGKIIQDGGVLLSDVTTMSANAAASGRVITSAGANKTQQDGGVLLSNIPTMASAAAASGRVITSAGADKSQQDSGVLLSALALLASPTFTGTPLAPTAAVGTSTTQIATTAFVQGEKGLPLASKSAAYTTVLADANLGLFHPSADTTARVWTIDSNANVPYPIGTTLTFENQNGAGVITIAITSDTMRLAGAGTTGSRTLAANGIATARKQTSTEWLINGTGLT